jgi:hypothetical protein
MRKFSIAIALVLVFISAGSVSRAENLTFKQIDSRIADYRKWLDQLGSNGLRYWLRLDSTKRPHRLYVGDGFTHASFTEQENFMEIFSRFLAGHPEKNMLIDIYDPASDKMIGEYGFGGFKMFLPATARGFDLPPAK